ncbi:MAG: threonylcarbamoyladenosine tRNA methylthiotransferase [Candidatus Woesearchaeota archaeon]|nr:MAG: threonylcarbamoyladenosine tRNA methylthiotransferase [Candidatus Woesearchaeota archaeon]
MTSKKTVYIKTFGCSLNQTDSENMAGILLEAGFDVITNYGTPNHIWMKMPESKKDFDVVIINTCSVKNLAESKFLKEFKMWKNAGKTIVVAGCIPQADPEILETTLKGIPVIGTRQIVHVAEIVKDAINGKVVQNISNDYNERLNLPKIRKTGIIEILPISEGCLSNCTYCKTKFARGELLSYPKEKILLQFKNALSSGCKEFWITSQDNGCYGFDIYRKEKYFLPQLLNDMLKINGDFKIRLGMANPDHIKRIKDDLIETFKHPKMYKFLHIPVQSGSNKILKLMKRMYTAKDYIDIVNDFKKNIPEITISTDIIVGFPEESNEDFEESVKLLKETKPDVLNLSRFWLRKGTAAEKMKQIEGGISKKRSEKMKKIFDKIAEQKNKQWIGKYCNSLIDEIGKNNTLIARNDSYKQIIIKNDGKNKVGDFVKIKITDSGVYDLRGEIISN